MSYIGKRPFNGTLQSVLIFSILGTSSAIAAVDAPLQAPQAPSAEVVLKEVAPDELQTGAANAGEDTTQEPGTNAESETDTSSPEVDVPGSSSQPENAATENEEEVQAENEVLEQTVAEPTVVPPIAAAENFMPTVTQLVTEAPQPDLTTLPLFGVRTSPYGTLIKRISSNAMFGASDGEARHNYSARQVWNIDETILDIGNKFVKASNMQILKSVPLSSERVWSSINPNHMFGMLARPGILNKFVVHDLSDDSTTIIKEFTDYSHCYIGNGKGNLSNDDRYILFVCSGGSAKAKTAVSYDIQEDKILGTLRTNPGYKWGGFSQTGEYIVIADTVLESEKLQVRYDKYLKNPLVLSDSPGHSDLAINEDGEDVLVQISWDYVFYYKLSNGERVNLGVSNPPYNNVGHGHISCRAVLRPGWCYISSYGPDRLAAVKLTAKPEDSVAEMWGHHSTDWRNGGYRAQPQISASPSGRQVVYASNNMGKGEINSYLITLE